ncbi:hypothetical protein CSA37_10990 [Candidatus Fermentibacteria bacterium]|nr:MAG: hypothetical protein CSA37_10990 [Candidatus Fermentibacteria bacterium]
MSLAEKVTVTWLGNRVGGIARPPDSPAVFIRDALPGETVLYRPLKVKKSFIEGELVSIEEPSSHRIQPFCRHFGRCGGCSLQHLDYHRELYWKRKWVEKAMRNLKHPPSQAVLPSPARKGCRNKITFDVFKGRLHLHAFRGDPVPVDSCPQMNLQTQKAFELIKNTELPSETTRVSVRGALNTSCRALEFTGTAPDTAEEEGLSVHLLRGGEWQKISGSGMTEKLCGFTFPVPAGGFFQVNSAGAELLIQTVLDIVPSAEGRILDLYGGAGTFGVPLAARGYTVHSVEMNRKASAACRRAGELNDIIKKNLTVTAARDRSFLSEALQKREHFDVVVTDPPRAGMGIRISRQIRRLAPEKLIYVSCNPFSAVRDINIFIQGGYTIKKVQPVDMFPGTDHVETVFLLERGDS